MLVNITVNNEMKTFHIEAGEYLLDTLRRYDYLSVKRGCDNTSCGVCTILVDGKPMPSCSILSARMEGHAILTVEGIPDEVDKIAHYFGEEGADQCGYCNPSLAITIYAMKKELKNPSIKEVKEYLVGHLCRCTGYIAQERAIMKYLGDQ